MSGKIGKRSKYSKKSFYSFYAIKEKSIRFPLDKKTALVFDRKFTEKLPSLEMEPIKGYSEIGWIGKRTQSQRKISNSDAITILEEYYRKSHDERVREIINES